MDMRFHHEQAKTLGLVGVGPVFFFNGLTAGTLRQKVRGSPPTFDPASGRPAILVRNGSARTPTHPLTAPQIRRRPRILILFVANSQVD